MNQEENQLPPISDTAVERYNEDAGSSAIAVRSLDDIKRLSTIFIGSGMFKGDRSLSQAQQIYQAGVKIIAGVEFGIQPFAAMRGINIINGNAEMSANLMAAKVKKHPKYDYRVKSWDNDGCVIEFFEIMRPGDPRDKWDSLGESSFTQEDAERAQLAGGQNWRKFARNMFFARAMSNGVRIYTPDVFYGAPVYVEGEISGDFEKAAPAASEEPQVAEVEVIDQADTIYRDIAAEEAEIAEPVNDSEPQQETEAPAPNDDIEAVIQQAILDLPLPMQHKRQLVRVVTGKPFLKNCTPEEMTAVAEAIEGIKAGTFTRPTEWDEDEKAA